MLNEAFETLKKYDWGTDVAELAPIQDAVVAAHDDAALRADLENRLIAALQSALSRDAKDFVCRKLAIVGSAAAVPALAGLLASKDHSHMARFALERIPAPEAAQALRDALATAPGSLKIGVISSIGGRRDPLAAPALGRLLLDSDPAIARAAALALGEIGSAEGARLLQEASQSAGAVRQAAIDGLLANAESLLAAGKQGDASNIYNSLTGDASRLVRLAATRGLLACASKQS